MSNLSEDSATFYKKRLDTIAKKNPGQCYCSSCTPKRISSGFWFGYFHGDNIYAVCHEFIDRYAKKLPNEILPSTGYTKGLSCIKFYIKQESLLNLKGFCQNCKIFMFLQFDLKKIDFCRFNKYVPRAPFYLMVNGFFG